VRFQVLTDVLVKIQVFWDVTIWCNIKEGGFGGLEDACWPLVPKFAGSNPAKAIRIFRAKNPQHAFLWRGSKAGGPMS
jgi:hypothetical protein